MLAWGWDSCESLIRAYHGKVRDGSKGDDERGDDVVKTLRNGNGKGQAGEDNHRDQHDHEDNPTDVSLMNVGCR